MMTTQWIHASGTDGRTDSRRPKGAACLLALFEALTVAPGCTRLGFGEADTSPERASDQRTLEISTLEMGAPDRRPGEGGVAPGTFAIFSAGTFIMGSPESELCREPAGETQHLVTLTHSFEIQTTEVTQAQFEALMGYNLSAFKSCGPGCPVDLASWHEMAAYCNALSTRSGHDRCYGCSGAGASVTCLEAPAYSGQLIYTCPGYRLPTEAEWEYAYRAQTSTAYYSDTNDGASCSSCSSAKDSSLDAIGWYCANSGWTTHPVAQRQPNAGGLFDMAGNVWEWCEDWLRADLGANPVTDPVESSPGVYRMMRGGALDYPAQDSRAAARAVHDRPESRRFFAGGRCVRTL